MTKNLLPRGGLNIMSRNTALTISISLFSIAFLCAGFMQASQLSAQESIRYSFDIERKSLTAAVDEYAAATGRTAIVDASLIVGKYSTVTSGTMPADAALHRMISGTGLLALRSGNAFSFEEAPYEPDTELLPEFENFYAILQDILGVALCGQPLTRPGNYHAVIRLWFAANGGLKASELVGSTGDERRDGQLGELLSDLWPPAPPPGMPQPVTVVLREGPADKVPQCAPQNLPVP